MGIASHRGWLFSRAVPSGSGAQADDARAAEAARWALTVLAKTCNGQSGGRILFTSVRHALHNSTLAVARKMVQLVFAEEGREPVLPSHPQGGDIAHEPAGGVVLVDTSQGAVALSSILQLPRSPGLAELCQHRARFEEVIHRDPVSRLHFVPSGRPRAVGGAWGEPGAADRVFRALDASHRCVLFCAEWEEALLLAETMKRSFCAAIVIASGRDAQSSRALHKFGFPVLVLSPA